MGKIRSSGYGLCLVASLVLNLFFFINLKVGDKWNFINTCQQLSWSQRAAAEAEAVASVSCSGHGRAYLDGTVLHDDDGDGKIQQQPVCECNTCFDGPNCSIFIPDCAADADSGDPLFLEPFWTEHASSSAVLVAGWHRMSYRFSDDSFISEELEKHIRKVHDVSRNAVTAGRYIVFGSGSTQLLNAAVYALSTENSSSPTRVVASIPYYPLYKTQTDFFRAIDYEFQGDTTSLLENYSDSPSSVDNVIEFVTSPNNPDGQLKKAVLQGSSVKAIHDHAYYWPHFTAIPFPADDDLMIFTISKLTGHAGSRFGWAVIKDEDVYQRMVTYMAVSEMGVSRDAQLRALKLLKVVLQGNGRKIFEFAYKHMSDRWEKLNRAVSMSTRFSLQQITPQFCTFFQQVRGPSPAYAWLKCEGEEDEDCNAILLKEANIIGRAGNLFSAENRFVRLSLLKSQDDFDLLLDHLTKLVSLEAASAKTM